MEHILPLNPSKEALQEARFKIQNTDYDNLISRIGNFVPLNKKTNESIGNKAFSEKKSRYIEKGHSPSVKDLAKYKRFTKKEIEARSKEDAEVLNKIIGIMFENSCK